MAAEPEAIIQSWIKTRLGAAVLSIERQGRWRPAWFVDAEKGGEKLEIYVRGARLGYVPYDLPREWRIHRLLESGGVRVPRLYGYIDEIPAIVMARVAGRSNLGTADSEADRASVREQLAEQMALMHGLDAAPFRQAGLRWPSDPADTTLSFFNDVHEIYRTNRRRPDPRFAFIGRWLERNPRVYCDTPHYIACDAGQFMFDGPRLTAMIDLELSILGDPMADLAALRVRGQREPLGDLPSLYRLYGEKRGRAVDFDAVRYQTIAFAAAGAMASVLNVEKYLANPTPDEDYVEYLTWVEWQLKQAYEAMAEYLGWELIPFQPPLPETNWGHDALEALANNLAALDETGTSAAYRKRIAQSGASYLDRLLTVGRQCEADYLNDAKTILGWRPKDSREADALLEEHVLRAGAEEDESLFHLLHAAVARRCFLLATPSSLYLDGLIKPLARI